MGQKDMQPNILPLSSVINPRDLGGLVGYQGRKIKSHRLIRTGDLSRITAQDKKFLLDYGLTKIIDLRSRSEQANYPDPLIKNVENISLPLSKENGTLGDSSNLDETGDLYHTNLTAASEMMCEHYRDHVIEAFDQQTVAQVLQILAETRDGAVIFHCTEGKDRTGFVNFFVLYLLGVDLETIRQDYLASNYILDEYRAICDKQFKQAGENLVFRSNMRVLSSASDTLFDTILVTIEEKFNGIGSYLRKQLSITDELRQNLRELYLEK